VSEIIDGYLRSQYGIITRRQAAEVLTEGQITHRTRTGTWIVVRRSVYRVRSSPPTWEADVLAAVIERPAVASHRTAVTLLGLDRHRRRPIEFTVPRSAGIRPVRGLHTTTQWAGRGEVTIGGIACTGVERTILDCAAVTTLRHVELLAEAAIRKNMTSWARLHETLEWHSEHGRNGCGRLRELLGHRAGSPTVTLSDFSLLVRNLLIDAGLPQPVVEYPVTDENGDHILAVDLAWPRWKRAWELDGLAFHGGRTDHERDRRKRNRLVEQGWMVQEILWSMYEQSPEQLVDQARRFLRPAA